MYLKTNVMKNLLITVLITFGFGSFCTAQDFSFDELVHLRSGGYHAFSSYVHDKGYEPAKEESTELSLVFRNDKNVVSFTHRNYGDGLAYHSHPSVTYETPNKQDYEILKKQIESELKYYSTGQHKNRKMHYTEYIYANDVVVARLYDIAYRNDDKPYYRQCGQNRLVFCRNN